jgi:hypothetical protein
MSLEPLGSDIESLNSVDMPFVEQHNRQSIKDAGPEQLQRPAYCLMLYSLLLFPVIIPDELLRPGYPISGTTRIPLPGSAGVLLNSSHTLYTTDVMFALPP